MSVDDVWWQIRPAEGLAMGDGHQRLVIAMGLEHDIDDAVHVVRGTQPGEGDQAGAVEGEVLADDLEAFPLANPA